MNGIKFAPPPWVFWSLGYMACIHVVAAIVVDMVWPHRTWAGDFGVGTSEFFFCLIMGPAMIALHVFSRRMETT